MLSAPAYGEAATTLSAHLSAQHLIADYQTGRRVDGLAVTRHWDDSSAESGTARRGGTRERAREVPG